MAPDKIFMNYDILGNMHVSEFENPSICGEEYIHKSALLEWLNDMKHLYEFHTKSKPPCRLCIEKAKAFKMVIDKIESL